MQARQQWKHARNPIICLFCLLLNATQLSWAQDCGHPEQTLDGLPISSIEINNGDIFDPNVPDQNLWIHRVANELHIKTRKETIEGMLLVQSNQPYSERLARETERLIRAQDYIHDVEIESEPICEKDDKRGVKLKVVSTDNWTLTPSLSVGHSGGETRTSAKLEESNLLGLGIEVRLKTESDEDRDQNSISFKDSDWYGNRKQLDLSFSDNSDGYLYQLELSRPFFQLDSKYAWSTLIIENKLERPIFAQGILSDKVGETFQQARFSYGWSDGLIDNKTTRWRLGLNLSESRFFRTSDFPTTAIPETEIARYPFLEYNFVHNEYLEISNFNLMGVTEDIAVGNRLVVSAGWKDEAFGSTREGHVLKLDYAFGSLLATQTFGLFDLSLSHEANSTTADTGFLSLGGKLYHYQDQDHSYLFGASYEAAQSPELFEQYTLGGDNGLKGYPIRYQNGDRKLTLSIEKRSYFKWYPLQMFKLGTAIFAETGSAWNSEENPNFISDIGFGLRLVSTRQSNSKVLHADIAFPLSEREQVDSYQIFIKAQTQF